MAGPGDGNGKGFADVMLGRHGPGDRLTQTDGGTGVDRAFNFLAAGASTGVAGRLHYVQHGGNTCVEGDTDGDRLVDFSIRLDGTITLTGADFVL